MDNNNFIINVPSVSKDKQVYTVLEIGAILRISKSKAYELCKQNLFKTINIGRSIRVSKESFDKWLNNQDQ